MDQDQDQQHLSEEDVRFIDELVRVSGRTALEMREGVGVHTKNGPHDLVTDADLKLSSMIKSALCERFPSDLIVSEEDRPGTLSPNASARGRVWLIDPIDGTRNYVKQDGQYSSMIGLLLDERPHYGWIYQPTTATLFSGGPQYGAWKQIDGHKRRRYPACGQLAEHNPMRLMIGWGDRRRYPWIARLPDVIIVPSESMGLKIVKILENEADMFVSLSGGVKLWDTAAPAAIAAGSDLDTGTVEGSPLPFPLPEVQHGSSVVIGRAGTISWALKHVSGHTTRSVPKPAP